MISIYNFNQLIWSDPIPPGTSSMEEIKIAHYGWEKD
jgi:hypothetical protein